MCPHARLKRPPDAPAQMEESTTSVSSPISHRLELGKGGAMQIHLLCYVLRSMSQSPIAHRQMGSHPWGHVSRWSLRLPMRQNYNFTGDDDTFKGTPYGSFPL
jgi:hypothetical protein